jgi:hypothetical protein
MKAARRTAQHLNIPCKPPLNREWAVRDEFADDCVHRHFIEGFG